MPVNLYTYLYIILMVADALCIILSAIKRDGLHEIFIPCLPLFIIGYFANRYAIQSV